MQYEHITPPENGVPVTANPDHTLNVPDRPIIPCIEGDGIGIDVTPVGHLLLRAVAMKFDEYLINDQRGKSYSKVI